MKHLARLSVARPLLIIGAWILALAGVTIASTAAGDAYSSNFSLPGTDAQAASDLLAERFPTMGNAAVDQIVWKVDNGSWDDPAVRTAIEGVAATITSLDSVVAVTLPFDGAAPGQVSPNGTVAYGVISYTTESFTVPTSDIRAIVTAVESVDDPGLTVAVGGRGIGQLNRPAIGLIDGLGVLVAALILFLAFRSATAMALPVLSGLVSVGMGLGTVSLVAHGMDIILYAPIIGAILGIGVGIDYGLLILNRHRAGLMRGLDVGESIVASIATAGRAVLFAGCAVVIGLVGMLVPRLGLLTGLAIGAGITVFFTVLAAISLLPAMMRLAGTRVLDTKTRGILARGKKPTEHPAGRYGLWAVFVSRHPVWVASTAVVLLAALAWPVAGLRLGSADQGNDPAGTTTREAYDMLAEGFGPGFNGPLLVALDLTDNPLDVAAMMTADPATASPPPQLAAFLGALATDPGVAAMVGPYPDATGDAAIIQVIPTTSPQDAATADLVHRIRDQYAPLAAAQSVGVHVGGVVPIFDDFADAINSALPAFFVVVILLGALLTVVAFRSLAIPAVGAVMNLLSIAAGFGVIVAIFQWGWGASFLGTGGGGPIESFFPLVVFALLFGLSTDYQVFLVTRIAEEWHIRHDNTKAVRAGHAEVSRVIVSAAAIMIVVFAGFAVSDSRMLKLFGLGLAAAVLVDAFIIRMALVPALMRLIGSSNWRIPRWLDRVLPHVAIEEASAELPVSPVAPPSTTQRARGKTRATSSG
jgi:RND superfamily putative drug exporter